LLKRKVLLKERGGKGGTWRGGRNCSRNDSPKKAEISSKKGVILAEWRPRGGGGRSPSKEKTSRNQKERKLHRKREKPGGQRAFALVRKGISHLEEKSLSSSLAKGLLEKGKQDQRGGKGKKKATTCSQRRLLPCRAREVAQGKRRHLRRRDPEKKGKKPSVLWGGPFFKCKKRKKGLEKNAGQTKKEKGDIGDRRGRSFRE